MNLRRNWGRSREKYFPSFEMEYRRVTVVFWRGSGPQTASVPSVAPRTPSSANHPPFSPHSKFYLPDTPYRAASFVHLQSYQLRVSPTTTPTVQSPDIENTFPT